ncbi:MAG: hypothetical protein K0R71_1480 [Bacillales bacterium]|jgi:hypothetical protein|nr:hypothetical protein [Bacillales bacterium]
MKHFFIKLVDDLVASMNRFIAASFFTVCLFLVGSYIVIFEPIDSNLNLGLRIILTISFGILFCTFTKLLFERFSERLKVNQFLLNIAMIVLSAISYFFLKNFDTDNYVVLGYVGIMTTFFVGIIYLSTIDNLSKSFSFILKNIIFYIFICGIITAGTMLCIFAFDSLIYKFTNIDKGYQIIGLAIWSVLFLNLFLASIPHRDSELKIPNIFKTIVVYAALPVYLILIVILYVYIGKLIANWSFSSGNINWFASFAAAFFVFFAITVEQYKEDNKLARLFIKYGGYFIIPIVLIQFMAMYIRVSNYGLTFPRYVSVVLNMIALLFSIASLVKGGKYSKQMLPVIMCATLLLTITPLNAIDVPIRNQSARLVNVLNKYDMIQNENIVQNSNVSDDDKIKISDSYQYIVSSGGHLPSILNGKASKKSFSELFGFEMKSNDQFQNERYVNYYYEYKSIQIAGYSEFYSIQPGDLIDGDNGSKILKLNQSGNPITFDPKKEISELYSKYGEQYNKPMVFETKDGKIILTSISFTIDNTGNIKVMEFFGYFLLK